MPFLVVAGGPGPRSAHFRPSLLKTFLFPEDFGIVFCFCSGFESDFSYSDFNPLCVSVFSSLCLHSPKGGEGSGCSS